MPGLDDRQRRALAAYRQVAVRVGDTSLLPPSDDDLDLDTLQRFVATARLSLGARTEEASREQAQLQADAASRPRVGADEAAWKRLDDAIRKIEAELRAPNSLRARMDEGRRSMLPKVEQLIQQSLEPQVLQERGTLTARVAPEGTQALTEALPLWVEAWSRYTCGWLDLDLQRVMQEVWTPREGDLPLAPPVLPPLEARAVKAQVVLPELVLNREQLKLGAGLYRNARSVLYGILSLTFLLGLRGGDNEGVTQTALLVVGMLVAVFIGFTQVQTEREKEKARLAEDLLKSGRAEVREAVRHCLERAADRLADDIRTQLFERRMALVQWYRSVVVPAQERREQEAQAAILAAEKARQTIPRLQERQRELRRVADELERLGAALV